jgi:hypothetical protein
MTSRKTLILGVAMAVVVTVPTVAWALNDPPGADPQPPPASGNAVTDALYGWMGEMHDYMWTNGELPKDLPSDAADRMNQMHDSIRGSAPLDGSSGWMGSPGSRPPANPVRYHLSVPRWPREPAERRESSYARVRTIPMLKPGSRDTRRGPINLHDPWCRANLDAGGRRAAIA